MNFSGGRPFPKQRSDRRVVLDRCSTNECSSEFLDEQLAISLGQERHPREDIVNSSIERGRAVNSKVAQQSRQCFERFGAIIVSISLTKPQSRCVPTPKQHIVIDQLGNHALGLAQEL